ncbi:hypothetical protein BDZ91DRAFT_757591 [Kalaharituber pfeilii]|nr:hypothetical protein BDZ91DRAFT_757591 [Kalaharituber pfeilii]
MEGGRGGWTQGEGVMEGGRGGWRVEGGWTEGGKDGRRGRVVVRKLQGAAGGWSWTCGEIDARARFAAAGSKQSCLSPTKARVPGGQSSAGRGISVVWQQLRSGGGQRGSALAATRGTAGAEERPQCNNGRQGRGVRVPGGTRRCGRRLSVVGRGAQARCPGAAHAQLPSWGSARDR